MSTFQEQVIDQLDEKLDVIFSDRADEVKLDKAMDNAVKAVMNAGGNKLAGAKLETYIKSVSKKYEVDPTKLINKIIRSMEKRS